MGTRFHLDSVSTKDGTLWFTLVIENPTNYFVELYNDSSQPFLTERTKIIKPIDFKNHQVNGVPLVKLVENTLKGMVETLQSLPR